MSNPPVTPDRIAQLGKAFRASKALFSAVELGVFSILASGPRKLDALTTDVGIAERGARDFFDALVALQLLERDDTGCYRNSAEADHFLDRGKPTYVGGELDHFNKRGYPLWHSLTAALKSGKPQSVASARQLFFGSLFRPRGARNLYRGNDGRSPVRCPGHRNEIPLASVPHGLRYRHVAGRSAGRDRPRACAHHRRRLRSAPGAPAVRELREEARLLAKRLHFHAGDFLRDPLPEADVLIIGRVLHNWDVATKKMLLRKAHDALPPAGSLIVYERMIDDGRQTNAAGLLASLNMLIMTDGGFDYTSEDLIGWMKEAGFRDLRVEPVTSELSMVVGIK